MTVESNEIIAIAMIRVSRQFFKPTRCKTKATVTLCARFFSRLVCCKWLPGIRLLLISRSNNFDIGFTIVIRKSLYTPSGCIVLFARSDWPFYPNQNEMACLRSELSWSKKWISSRALNALISKLAHQTRLALELSFLLLWGAEIAGDFYNLYCPDFWVEVMLQFTRRVRGRWYVSDC